jgi:drug/metabolite transporter (DMT)-like permease
MATINWIRLAVLSLVWGGSFFFIEIALRGFSPLVLVAIRVSLAAATLLAIAFFRRDRFPTNPKVWRGYFIMGLISNAVPFSLITWAQTQIPSSLAAILNAVVPLVTFLMACRYAKDEELNGRKLSGVIVGFCGVAVLMLPTLSQGLSLYNMGLLAVLVAVTCYAASAIYGKRFTGTSAAVNAGAMLAFSAVVLWPLAFLIEKPLSLSPGLESWVALVALAELCSAFAYVLYFQVLKSAGATGLVLVTYLIPITATFLGVVFLNERLHPNTIAGVLVIFTGLVVVDGRLLKWLGRRSAAETP